MKWSRKAMHMSYGRWRDVTSGSSRRFRYFSAIAVKDNQSEYLRKKQQQRKQRAAPGTEDMTRDKRLEYMVSKIVRRWQRQGMGRAWESWYEHHVKRATLKRLSRHFMLHWTHVATSRAWTRWDEATSQLRQKRMMVARAIGRWRTPAVVEAFEQWLEEVMERKRSSDLNERDLRIMGLESDMSEMQESWSRG